MEIEQMRLVTEFASLAPSVHNTQPWRFVVTGHTLEVRADDSRRLSYLDPTGRQLHLSCGAAVELARLAVRSLGYQCTVRLVPKRDEDRALLATLTLGQRQPPSAEEQRLIDAAPRRYTDRGPYENRPLPGGLLRRLRHVAQERGCWLRILDPSTDRVTASVLLAVAESAENGDPRYAEELARWRRHATAIDGVPDEALRWLDETVVADVPLRDFAGAGVPRRPDPSTTPRVERDPLVLVGTDADTPVEWLRAGRAIASLMLQLTAEGLTCQPLGPVTDLPLTRRRLQRELGLIGHPQLLLRIGVGTGAPTTGRRPVDAVVTVSATG